MYHLGVGSLAVVVIGLQHAVDRDLFFVGGGDNPVYRHIGVEDKTGIGHRHHKVNQPFAQPGVDFQAGALVQLLRRVDPNAHLSGIARPLPHHRGHIAHKVRQHRHLLRRVFRGQAKGIAPRCGGEVQFHSVHGIARSQLC